MKVLCSGQKAPPTINRNIEWSCDACSTGAGTSSILCQKCNHWIQKHCSGIAATLKKIIHYAYKKCKEEITTQIKFNSNPDTIGAEVFKSVSTFNNHSDMIGGIW